MQLKSLQINQPVPLPFFEFGFIVDTSNPAILVEPNKPIVQLKPTPSNPTTFIVS